MKENKEQLSYWTTSEILAQITQIEEIRDPHDPEGRTLFADGWKAALRFVRDAVTNDPSKCYSINNGFIQAYQPDATRHRSIAWEACVSCGYNVYHRLTRDYNTLQCEVCHKQYIQE